MIVIRRVRGVSMVPVLPPGQIIVGVRLVKKLRPGHVVIFKHEGKEMIKRVSKMSTDGIFVVGDHLEQSIDSRHFGPIQHHQLIARVIYPKLKRRVHHQI